MLEEIRQEQSTWPESSSRDRRGRPFEMGTSSAKAFTTVLLDPSMRVRDSSTKFALRQPDSPE